MRRAKAFIATGILVPLLVTTGCSLINPHVTWKRPDVADGKTVTLPQGMEYADRAIKEYKDAIGQQAILTSVICLGIIPLGLATLGLGITEAGAKAVTILGITTAGVYGTGVWLSSKPRQLVYASGIAAMTCAKDAMAPLNLREETNNPFGTSLSELPDAISTLEYEISKVKGIIKTNQTALEPDLVNEAHNNVKTAEAALKAGRSALANGSQLERELDRAGSLLVSAVDRIGAQVDIALVRTEPNIDALPGILGDLTKTYSQFTKVPESPTSTAPLPQESRAAESAPASQQLVDELGELGTSVKELATNTYSVAAVINSLSEANPAKTLKNCKLEPVDTGIEVQPAGDIEFDEEETVTRSLVVTGGKPSYFAYLLEKSVQGLTAESKPSAGLALVEIVKSGKVPSGTYHVYISDTAGNSKTVNIVVSTKQEQEVNVTVGTGVTPTYTWSGGNAVLLTVTRTSSDVPIWQVTSTSVQGFAFPVTHGTVPANASQQIANPESPLTRGGQYKVTVLRKDNKSGFTTFTLK
jgi:hypothetical protein